MLVITKFNALVIVITNVLCTIMGVEFHQLAMSYINEGQGLHPGLAYLIVGILLAVMVISFFTLHMEVEEEDLRYIA